MRILCVAVCAVLCTALSAKADFAQDFEVNASGWNNTTRVASGTNGIPAAGGNWYGQASASGGSAYTTWGGYNTVAVPFISSIAVYLDLNAFANDTLFDLTTAVSKPDGTHRRDFNFAVGFYDDATGPGAGTDRFVVSASNNTPGWPKDPGRGPTDVTATGGTGWYTFEHDFRDNGFGILEVEMSVYNPASTLVGNWLLSDPADVIGTFVGGNRYSWFANIESAPNTGGGWRAIDDTSLSSTAAVPEASPALFGAIACGVAGLATIGRRKLAKWFS